MIGVQNTYKSKCHIPNNLDETNENEDNEDITFFFDDRWFEFVNTAMNVRKSCNHVSFIIKRAHIRPLKQYLEEVMKYCPGGTWMIMTRRYEKEGIEKNYMEYKHNKNKMLIFVLTKRVGETYQARFPDKLGNVCVRYIARPEILSNYFKISNVAGLHYYAR